MRIVGLMSGTSADGIEAVLCSVTGAPPALEVRIEAARSTPFEPALGERIHAAARRDSSTVEAVCLLDRELGERFAAAALDVIAAAGLDPAAVDLVGSHGQTLWHAVDADGHVRATLQVGDPDVIAERTGITTIAGFRTRDVAAGGQGAPLVSTLDWLLFRHPDRWRAMQNIGGIGNVTFLPPLRDRSARPVAFDTGPGNALIDGLAVSLSGGADRYDRDGERAARGTVDEAWLAALMTHPYYARRPPKTTGRELFGPALVDALLAEGRARGLDDDSIVATVTALTAATIALAVRRDAPAPIEELVVAGGGVRNPVLMAGLAARLPGVRITDHDALDIGSVHKEAVCFAVMAHETWFDRPWSIPELTGVSHPVVLGRITPGARHAELLRRTRCGEAS